MIMSHTPGLTQTHRQRQTCDKCMSVPPGGDSQHYTTRSKIALKSHNWPSSCDALMHCDLCSCFYLFPAEGSSSSLAAVLCSVGVAIVGAVTGYFTYQKKKLCFKNRDGKICIKHQVGNLPTSTAQQ
uniref:Uncharacterized protein n=1 Tax=Myripristis murdjan TaxID=586833 RepID=A0A668AJG0_9TELE